MSYGGYFSWDTEGIRVTWFRKWYRDAMTEALSKRQQNKIRKRADMLHAAHDLILGTGTTDFSMSELAKAADVALVTPYKYFDSKYGVLLALHNEHTKFLRAADEDGDPPHLDPLDRLLDFATLGAEGYVASEKLFRPLVGGMVKLSVDAVAQPPISNDWVPEWDVRLQAAKSAKELQKHVDTTMVARALHMLWTGIFLKWISQETNNKQFVAEIRFAIAVFLAGICTDDHRPALNRVIKRTQKQYLDIA